MTTYFGLWASPKDVFDSFEIPPDDSIELLFAGYESGCYEGSAFVLFRKDGKLYEVNGSHCSCHGLENQWDPEETTVEALRTRNPCYLSDELRVFLTTL